MIEKRRKKKSEGTNVMAKKRSKRKVVLFLVEGKSEINLLSQNISMLYDIVDPEIEVFFPTIIEKNQNGGDITSKYGIHPGVIEKCIYKLFMKSFFDKEKLYPKDIIEIIHIVDTDGVYIPDENIKYKANSDISNKIYYGENEILTANIESTLERNQRKRQNLDYLSSLSQIKVVSKTIKYSIFFFSTNLDHFLYENANLDIRSKTNIADSYAKQFENNPSGFISSIENTNGCLLNMNYEQSWEFIKHDINSIKRHTNINILFDRLNNQKI